MIERVPYGKWPNAWMEPATERLGVLYNDLDDKVHVGRIRNVVRVFPDSEKRRYYPNVKVVERPETFQFEVHYDALIESLFACDTRAEANAYFESLVARECPEGAD